MNPSRFSVNLIRTALLALASCALLLETRADDWAPNITTAATWHSNATRADASADRIESLQLQADLLSAQRYTYGRDDTLLLTTHLAGDWWPSYNGLLSGAAGGRIAWKHQFGPSPRAPIVSLEGAADAVAAKETGRRGVSTAVTASVRQRLNDLTRLTLSHEVAWFDARFSTFDSNASETSLELDRDLNSVTRLTFTARYRDGDVVSYASGSRPDLEAIAPNRLAVTTFNRPMTAYRVDARTWSARLALVHALDQNSAIIGAYEWRKSDRTPLSFTDHLLSVALVHQF